MNGSIGRLNDGLAKSCMSTCAACCKKGRLFLPLGEFQSMIDWLRRKAPGEEEEFVARCEAHDGFLLYDQQERCGFLDDGNLCRLHDDGVKPTECLAWPFHIYGEEGRDLEIRYSTSCCSAHEHIEGNPADSRDYAEGLFSSYDEEQVREFRAIYGGSYGTKPLCKWHKS